MDNHYERITQDPQFDGKVRDAHEIRYRIASQFLRPGDGVLDAGCGTGYGASILQAACENIKYTGVDSSIVSADIPYAERYYIEADFDASDVKDFVELEFDVFVGLEIIEHLTYKGVKTFAEIARRARRRIIISTPIVASPNNPYHIQQFSKKDISKIIAAGTPWRLEHYIEQDYTYGIFIFKKNDEIK
jgi:cyclopropane fatty-acyl-phospholipid synthase-like methyltransferase